MILDDLRGTNGNAEISGIAVVGTAGTKKVAEMSSCEERFEIGEDCSVETREELLKETEESFVFGGTCEG